MPAGCALLSKLPPFATAIFHLAAATSPRGWQALLTDKVILCGAAALALFALSLLLRGLLKLISIGLVVVLALGAFWFFREGWIHRSELIPSEWTALAEKTLEHPKAKAAWDSVQLELNQLTGDAQQRLAAGTDDARNSLLAKLDARSKQLRKEGHKSEAAEIDRFAQMLSNEK